MSFPVRRRTVGAVSSFTEEVTPEALTARLQELVHESKKVDVAIAGDEGTSYKNIVKVMDLVRAAGISSVALATNPTT